MADEKKLDMPFDMAGLIENAFLMGVGVLEVTREKTNSLADELIERGKLSKSDAKDVADKVGEVAEKQQEVVRTIIGRETDRAMKNAGMATKEDVESLKAEIAELKALLAKQAGIETDTVQ